MALRPNHRPPKRSLTSRDAAIVAAAEQLAERLDKSGTAGGTIGEGWQREFWDLYDRVPEIRTSCRITGRAAGQCRLVLARFNNLGEPVPLDTSLDENGKPNNPDDYEHPGVAMLAALAGGQHGQSELLDSIGVALAGPGETILVGALDQTSRDMADDFTRMQAYSTSQVVRMADKVVVKLDNSRTADRPLATSEEAADDPSAVVAIRVWRPHPRFSWLADSPCRSALAVLREIVGYDDHIRASLLSRLAGAGIMWVPEDIDLPGLIADDEPDGDGTVDPFLRYLMEVMSLAIRDRSSAAALTPILARGSREDIAAVKHMTFSTPFDDKVSEYRREAVGRFGVAVDMPGELLTGMASLQHWTGALITEDWRGGYLAEIMGFATAALTYGWFYPAMIAAGHGDLESDVIVWYDDSSVRTRENTGPEVQAAYDRGEISGDTLRRVLGFDEGDAPTDDEFIQQVAKILLLKNPSLAPLLLPLFGVEFTDEQISQAQTIRAVVNGTPTEEPPGPTASGGYVPRKAAVPPPAAKPAAPAAAPAPAAPAPASIPAKPAAGTVSPPATSSKPPTPAPAAVAAFRSAPK